MALTTTVFPRHFSEPDCIKLGDILQSKNTLPNATSIGLKNYSKLLRCSTFNGLGHGSWSL